MLYNILPPKGLQIFKLDLDVDLLGRHAGAASPPVPPDQVQGEARGGGGSHGLAMAVPRQPVPEVHHHHHQDQGRHHSQPHSPRVAALITAPRLGPGHRTEVGPRHLNGCGWNQVKLIDIPPSRCPVSQSPVDLHPTPDPRLWSGPLARLGLLVDTPAISIITFWRGNNMCKSHFFWLQHKSNLSPFLIIQAPETNLQHDDTGTHTQNHNTAPAENITSQTSNVFLSNPNAEIVDISDSEDDDN